MTLTLCNSQSQSQLSDRTTTPTEEPMPSTIDSWGNHLRSAYSESAISRVRSLEALSRRGLSDSAIGVPRIVGPSRLLKFFLNNNYHAHSTCSSPSKERGLFSMLKFFLFCQFENFSPTRSELSLADEFFELAEFSMNFEINYSL